MNWISVEERLPKDDGYILVSFENYNFPSIARYLEDKEGGAFYPAYGDKPYVAWGVFVNAWMPLPKPYSPKTDEVKPSDFERENKEDIVLRLKLLLKATGIGSNIEDLVLSEDECKVTILFTHGFHHDVDISCDSGYAIIKDVMKAL